MSLEADLAQFIGTEQYRYNPLYPWLKYTDGVHYFINNAGGGAYWLLDIIGTELVGLARRESFMTVDLTVNADESAEILVTDGNDKRLSSRKIEWTDCPQGVWRFFLQRGVLMLTSEY